MTSRSSSKQLGVNIDHIATLRQARGGVEPSVLEAALEAEQGGADSITVHLREDRRHIQDADVLELLKKIYVPLNLEMSVSPE
ncbi:MAG TPA: pyridoxine 5'-phosphate synthase, partial [Candidatus Omnitrophota bacterium]|nr:pyridoxine 5'-phosphate synthase [Candidatus Omnitrophota bacterium]